MWNGRSAGSTGGNVTVDDALSDTSENPVQNKVVKQAIDGKSNTGHTHDDRYYTETETNTKISDAVNALDVSDTPVDGSYIKAVSETDGKISVTREAADTTPTANSKKMVTSGGVKSALDGKANSSHTHDDRYYTETEIDTKLSGKLSSTLKGSANGLAELDANGKVPSSQLPSYVDDVKEGYLKTADGKFYKESTYTTEMPAEADKIYVDKSTDTTYRWSGSAYVAIGSSLALGETSSTAYRGDRGKIAYDHSQSAHARTDATKVEASETNGNIKINGTETTVYEHPGLGTNPHGTTKSDVGLGNVGNFKAVSTVASQGLSDTEKANARANIGAGTSSFSGSYNDLTDKPTIPTVNNATLTIQKNGTTVKTFTANASSNVTANITVPTKTSELTNDSNFVTSDTKNTAGSTDTSDKIFLIGAKSQAANPQTYSHDTAYVGTDGCLYSGGIKVLTSHQDISGKMNANLKGVANGVAELDSSGKVPSSQLPSYVDDVLEYDSQSAFPSTGETGKIYVAKDTNKSYRWTGSAYSQIKGDLALGETSSTAYRGDRGKVAYDHSQSTHARTDATKTEASSTNGNIKINGTETKVYTHPGSGTNPHGTTKSDVGLGNVPNVTTDNQTPSFTEASTRANIATGEKLSVIFGKIKKYFTDLKAVAFSGSYNDLSDKPTIPTNTDSKVSQTATTTSADYEVLFSSTADNTTRTEGARKNSNLKFNPSTGNLQATKLNGVDIGNSPKFTDSDTKNTAGSTDSSSKLFLIGATSQAANPQTYSHDTAYVGTDGFLYSGSKKVLTDHQDISGKANLASPTFTGTPKAPTATAGTNTTQIATTAFVQTAVANACETLVIDVSAFSSLPQTVNNSAIESDMVVVNSVLGTPSAQTADWTVTTSNGSLTISGTNAISGSTTLTLYLMKSR